MSRTYGQYCGLARALEILGERWGLLIVRDLLVGPRRFTDLLHGLPGIPTNVLTTRLRTLEVAGVVQRRALPRPESGVVYELTPYGAELEDAVVLLGRWGAKQLGEPVPGEVLTHDSMVMAMRSTFRPEAAQGLQVRYELRLGAIVIGVAVDDGAVHATAGPLAHPDLIVTAGPRLRELITGEVSADEALAKGIVHIEGDPVLLTRFAQIFRIDPLPVAAA